MYFSKLLIVLTLLLVIVPTTYVKAADKGVTDILTTNFEKSSTLFYKNTANDLVTYYKNQFDFYSNMVKNLIDINKLPKLLYSALTSIENETIKLYNSVFNYKKLITPSEL